MIFYYLFINMLIMGSLIFFLSLYFLINKMSLFLEFDLLKMISVKVEYLMLIDWISLMFISVVMMISSMVIFYSIEYMKEDLNSNRFMMMIMLFVMSMILMIISPNLISILLGWDGLGLVSYCLVIFYQNENSFNSGMVTVMTNRLGDILILMLIGLFMMNGSWNFMYMNSMNLNFSWMIMLAAFTKSAQIPFSSWLPLAMAAPTPVSSLVHSSTLVTAGVYLLIRFNYLMLNSYLMVVMMNISLMTMFMSGISAMMENDLKKIIALSTLSQLGVMIFCLSMGLYKISFFHLLIHAMFKSMLFMCAGVIIHNMLGIQDIRLISMVTLNMPVISMIFNCSSFSLCGIPFLSGFFSKDLILEMYLMNMMNKFMFMILFTSMGLTVGYSLRLMYYSFIKIFGIKIYKNYLSMSSFMMWSMILLFMMSIMMGVSFSWILFSVKNLVYLTFKFKLMIYFFMILGMFMGLGASWGYLSMFLMLGLMTLKKFYLMMWFLSVMYMSGTIKSLKFSLSLIYTVDLGWNEYLMGYKMMNFFKKIMFMDLYNKNFFFMLIFIMYISLMLLVF